MDRWVSGLNQQFAKLPYMFSYTGGSNPPFPTEVILPIHRVSMEPETSPKLPNNAAASAGGRRRLKSKG